MWPSTFLCIVLCLGLHQANASRIFDSRTQGKRCRNVPGSAGFPTGADFSALNTTVSGRLVKVIPFDAYCTTIGGCTLQQYTSSIFRDSVPGAMNQVNWETDTDSSPCEDGPSSTCGQGNVPLFGILAESVSDVQAGVNFARVHNLRLAVKSSGHDYLGRSTAKNSLLISTHNLQNSTFIDNFVVGGKGLGPAVTLGSGVSLSMMYQLTKAQGNFAVGGTASTVAAAGGYVQGGGHSSMAPFLGLASDNCLELNVVLANGQLVKANAAENPDLFWAMRGGGAGSWGVVVSATFRTFPTFKAVLSMITLTASTTNQIAEVATAQAKHIFDFDALRAGQYFYLSTSGLFDTINFITHGPGSNIPTMIVYTYFPNVTLAQANSTLQPFRDDLHLISGVNMTERIVQADINDILYSTDDIVGSNMVMGSRLIPETTYKNPALVGKVFSQLLNEGAAQNILVNVVAGGKVSTNANISSAVHPAWRRAKTHIIIANNWLDTATANQIQGNQTLFMRKQLPILEQISGLSAGAYSNEADSLEAKFQTTFFGPNYPRLSAIKVRVDPTDLFIVKAGVGSERWDSYGICRLSGA